jgi:hypothetical protein
MRSARVRYLSLIFFFVFSILMLTNPVYADDLIIQTSKPSYSLGATIIAYGTLTLGGSPITDGLVGLQVEDSQGNLKLVRVISTGNLPPAWKVRIVSLSPCDFQGRPQTNFARGALAYFNITVESLDAIIERPVVIALNMFDSIEESIAISYAGFSLAPGKQFTLLTSMPIPNDAFTGSATCCAGVLTGWPKEGGYPYCAEKSAQFTITAGIAQTAASSSEFSSTGSGGSYSLSFKLPSTSILGNYLVYGGARYNTWKSTAFDYYWIYTDVNRDGTVNILDISAAARAFGSSIGNPKYNRLADINGDGVLNILDVSAIAKDYRRTRL